MSDSPTISEAPKVASAKPKFEVSSLLSSQTLWMIVAVLAAAVFCFWPWFRGEVIDRWMDMDSYYAHGMLIPLCSAYLVWDKWDRIKNLEVKPMWLAVVPLLLFLYVAMVASRSIMTMFLSVLFVGTLLNTSLLIGGWKWFKALFAPISFLVLGLPVFDSLVDKMTMPLQINSTRIAYEILRVLNVGHPYKDMDTVIHLDNFVLNVAAACSGLKTTIAVTSAVIFFMLIARLRWWANLILAAIAIPLSMVINGIRISMIGMVGNAYGAKAGMEFHDYSGYIALILCFVILGWLTKKLGYK